MSVAAQRRYTVAEYLEIERDSTDVKHEYYDGELFVMAGANDPHNLIVGNLVTRLNLRLENEPCRVYPSDMMVLCPSGLRTYPDVSVVCERPDFESGGDRVLLNPLVIFEVLSPSTEAYDRGVKFKHYRPIPSLTHYVLVAQDRPDVDLYTRHTDGGWNFETVSGIEGSLKLTALGCSLPLSEIYLKVEFPPEPKDPRIPATP